MVDLAGATDAGVERLLGAAVALQGVRVEQMTSLFGESQAAFVPAKIHALDKAFMAEVAKGLVLELVPTREILASPLSRPVQPTTYGPELCER